MVSAAIAVFGGCTSSRPKPPVVAPAGAVGPTTTDARLHSTTTSLPPDSPAPPATEPAASAARLQSILLSPGDLPSGFVPAAEAGDDLFSRLICGLPFTDLGGATAEVSQALTRPRDRLRVVEHVDGFAGTAAAAIPLARLRLLSHSCHRDGTTSVTIFQPPEVGEEVAGLQLSGPTAVTDVAMVRSGSTVVIVALAAAGALPADAMRSVVHAAGTKLAVGTGG